MPAIQNIKGFMHNFGLLRLGGLQDYYTMGALCGKLGIVQYALAKLVRLSNNSEELLLFARGWDDMSDGSKLEDFGQELCILIQNSGVTSFSDVVSKYSDDATVVKCIKIAKEYKKNNCSCFGKEYDKKTRKCVSINMSKWNAPLDELRNESNGEER